VLTRRERQQLDELYAGRLAGFVAELHAAGPERLKMQVRHAVGGAALAD
jgi:hypothetical protein